MLKMGFSRQEIDDMPDGEAEAYMAAFEEIVNPDKPRTYKVKRSKGQK